MMIQALVNRSIPSYMPRVAVNNVMQNKSASHVIGMAAPSFVPEFAKKGWNNGVEWLAKQIGKFAGLKPVEKFTKWCVDKDVDYTNHLAAICANVLNGFYMFNVARSKKIEPEQKKPLMLNMFIGTMFSTAGGYLINGMIDKKLKPFDEAIKKHYGTNGDNVMKGFRIAKSLMVFQLLYRFACPVIATPIANHISNKIRDKKAGEKGNLAI